MATKKIPPPPPIASTDPAFNRWLLELTSILSDAGGIDPANIDGFTALQNQVEANSAAISALQTTTGGQSADIAALEAQVTTLTGNISTINGQITSLSARGELLFGAGAPAAGLGKVNDWYGDTAGAAGARVWIKKAVGVWTAFPF
jgi:hypothetical protein